MCRPRSSFWHCLAFRCESHGQPASYNKSLDVFAGKGISDVVFECILKGAQFQQVLAVELHSRLSRVELIPVEFGFIDTPTRTIYRNAVHSLDRFKRGESRRADVPTSFTIPDDECVHAYNAHLTSPFTLREDYTPQARAAPSTRGLFPDGSERAHTAWTRGYVRYRTDELTSREQQPFGR